MNPLRIFLLAALVLVVFGMNTSAETEPIAHWSFDEGEGNIAHDESGNGNDGTLENGPIWVDGIDGGALEFDGVDDYVQIENSNSGDDSNIGTILGDGSFSASLLYKASANPGSNDWDFLIDQRITEDYGNGWYIMNDGRESNKISFGIAVSADAEIVTQSTTSILSNTWYHIVATYNGSHSKLYINEYLEGTIYVGSRENNTSDMTFGSRFSANERYLSGIIDEVIIWNRTLSSEEIADIYDSYNLSLPCQTGDSKIADDGCNQCVCNDGNWVCTETDCAVSEDEEVLLPSLSLHTSLISIGLLAIFRRK